MPIEFGIYKIDGTGTIDFRHPDLSQGGGPPCLSIVRSPIPLLCPEKMDTSAMGTVSRSLLIVFPKTNLCCDSNGGWNCVIDGQLRVAFPAICRLVHNLYREVSSINELKFHTLVLYLDRFPVFYRCGRWRCIFCLGEGGASVCNLFLILPPSKRLKELTLDEL